MESVELRERILRRIWRVYYLRKVLNPVALKAYALALLVGGTASLVSLPNIAANVLELRGLAEAAAYLSAAIANAEVAVQALALAIAAVVVFLVRDVARRQLLAARA